MFLVSHKLNSSKIKRIYISLDVTLALIWMLNLRGVVWECLGRWVGHHADCAQSVREKEALACPQKGTLTISVIGEILGNGVAGMCWGPSPKTQPSQAQYQKH